MQALGPCWASGHSNDGRDRSGKADAGSDAVTQLTGYKLTEDESVSALAEPRDCGFVTD